MFFAASSPSIDGVCCTTHSWSTAAGLDCSTLCTASL